MCLLLISFRNEVVMTADGLSMVVKRVLVYEKDRLVELRNFESPPQIREIRVRLVLFSWITILLSLETKLTKAISSFLREYHGKVNLSYDCYAFANSAKELPSHKVPLLRMFWSISPKPKRIKRGSVIFLCSGTNNFHHAAIYIGFGLYISVYGAGGDLEVSTLHRMLHDFRATKVFLATPK